MLIFRRMHRRCLVSASTSKGFSNSAAEAPSYQPESDQGTPNSTRRPDIPTTESWIAKLEMKEKRFTKFETTGRKPFIKMSYGPKSMGRKPFDKMDHGPKSLERKPFAEMNYEPRPSERMPSTKIADEKRPPARAPFLDAQTKETQARKLALLESQLEQLKLELDELKLKSEIARVKSEIAEVKSQLSGSQSFESVYERPMNRTFEKLGTNMNRASEKLGTNMNRTSEKLGTNMNRTSEKLGTNMNRTFGKLCTRPSQFVKPSFTDTKTKEPQLHFTKKEAKMILEQFDLPNK